MGFDLVHGFLAEHFAPWVRALGLRARSEEEGVMVWAMPASADLVRGGGAGGGVVCGQALSSAADTVSVLSLVQFNGRFRACTTTDLQVRFLRPVPEAEVLFRVSALSNGRRMAVTEVTIGHAGTPKPCAFATCAFAYLED